MRYIPTTVRRRTTFNAMILVTVVITVGLPPAARAEARDVRIVGHNVEVDGEPYLPFGMVAHCSVDEYPRLKSLGVNSIHFDAVFLNYDPQGPADTEAQRIAGMHEVLDAAHRNGQTVLVQFGMHYIPKWLFERYPDAHMKRHDGSTGQGGWHPFCLDHPGVRDLVRQFLEVTVKGIKDHPALLTYCLWNGPHLYGHVCYSAFTQAKFHTHLQRKYETIDALNGAWDTEYTAFEQIKAPANRDESYWLRRGDYQLALQAGEEADPPVLATGLSANPIAWNDWARFRTANYAEYFEWEAGVIRSVDPNHPITTKIVPFDSDSKRVSSRAVNTRHWADAFCDAVGFDGYHHLDGNVAVRHYADFMRSMGRQKPAWNTEAGFAWADQRGRPSPAAERSAFWMQFARGVNGKWLFFWSPNQDFWQRYTYPDNSVQPGMHALAECSRQLHEHRRLLSRSRIVKPQVALLLSRSTGIHQTGDYAPGRDVSTVMQCLYRKHIPYQYVTEEDVEQGALGSYRALIVVGAIHVGSQVLTGIERFIREGGHVLANARFAEFDEAGRRRDVHPPPWMGARARRWHRQVRQRTGSLRLERQAVDIYKKPVEVKLELPTYASRPMRIVADSPHLGLAIGNVIGSGPFYGADTTVPYGDGSDLRSRGAGWGEQTWEDLEVLACGQAVATFADGWPAIVTTQRTLYIGRDTCWLNHRFEDGLERFMLNAGVERQAQASDASGRDVPPLDLVLCQTPAKWVLYAINSPQTFHYDGKPLKDVRVSLPGAGDVVELFSGETVESTSAGNLRQVALDFEEGEAKILVADKQ